MNFERSRPLIGVVGCHALPGSHAWQGESLEQITEAALYDAGAFAEGGFDGLFLQDIGNLPTPTRARPETIAALAVVGDALRREIGLPLGVSLLEEDPGAAIALAQAIGAEFVRIKVYVGAMVGAEGVTEAGALEALETRRRLGADNLQILADVHDRTRLPLVATSLEEAAWNAVWFGKADGLVVTGRNMAESLEWIERARASAKVPIWIGGGVDSENVRQVAAHADAMIVATSVKLGHSLLNPVDPAAVRRLVAALDSGLKGSGV